MSDRKRLLLVDDEAPMRQAVAQWLDLAGFDVDAHGSAEAAINAVRSDYEGVIITDLRMAGLSGMDLLRHVQQIDPDLPVVMITGHGDIQSAVEAMQLGAYDFIEKPFEPERLLDVVRRAHEKRRLVLENRRLRMIAAEPQLASRIIGSSRAAETIRRQVAELASVDVSVIIYGETGTGKDLVARCLHDFGPRKDGHYVPINCAAIPETMAESEFFGHDAGAFTGAVKSRQGKIEHANGGTLFLDEIDSMPASIQGKLLRVLQDKQFERLGANRSIAVDFRPIAASKLDLKNQPGFRSDLYYRLSVAELTIPPLRQRKDDILLLFDFFAGQAARANGREPRPLNVATSNRLMTHDWPGNIRELRNAAERYALGIESMQQSDAATAGSTPTLADQVDSFERAAIEQSLIEAGGRLHIVMEKLGLPRRTLTDKMTKYGLDRKRYTETDGQKSAPGQ